MNKIIQTNFIDRESLLTEVQNKCICIYANNDCPNRGWCDDCHDFCINYDDLVEIVENISIEED